MLPLLTFVIGIILFFRNGFQLGSRVVSHAQSRTIGLILMAPLALEFCASTVLVYNNIQFAEDGTFTLTPDAFTSIAGTLGTIELIAVLAAIGLSVYLIFGRSSSGSLPDTPSTFQSSSRPIQTTPDIMTVAEAAAYMRVSESDVMDLIDKGRLGAAKIGDTYRIAKIAVDDFMGRA